MASTGRNWTKKDGPWELIPFSNLLTANAGAVAAATGLTNSGLFDGQSDAFFRFLFELAREADSARRGD
jgi:hypothetical protein